MKRTIFDDIVEGRSKSWKVWENDEFLAFLTPFPNTPGFTVVIPKKNPGDYVFEIDSEVYKKFMMATKEVAELLKRSLDLPRVALIFEGTGVPYAHAKLIPMRGDLAKGIGSPVSKEQFFSEEYVGWLTTQDGPKMDDAELDKIQAQILKFSK